MSFGSSWNRSLFERRMRKNAITSFVLLKSFDFFADFSKEMQWTYPVAIIMKVSMESLFCKKGSKKNSISKGHLTYVWTFFFLEMCSISAWSILYVRHSCVLKNFAKWHCHAHYGNYTKFSAKTRIHDEEESYARKWPQFVCSQVQQLHDFKRIQRVMSVYLLSSGREKGDSLI